MNRTFVAALLVLAAAACTRAPELDTRTFSVSHLAPHEVEALVAPYVYRDRPEAPGLWSAGEQAITVRETPDNLAKIQRVLEEFDRARPDVRLRFQIIEADGFTDSDARIAEVEQELRKIFQFRGYRLAAEAVLTVTDRSTIEQTLSAGQDRYAIHGDILWQAGGVAQLSDIQLWRGRDEMLLQTSVSVRPGQTLVLGSSPKEGSTATLLLTVHAEQAEG